MARRDAMGPVSPRERERLEAEVVDLGHDRVRPLAGLIQGWADHVDRLVAERDVDPDDGSRWTPDDLVAALYIRDFVERGLRHLPADLKPAARRAIEPVDAAFAGFTVQDSEGLLRRWLHGDEPGDGWWWGRVPTEGPVAHDLRELHRRSP